MRASIFLFGGWIFSAFLVLGATTSPSAATKKKPSVDTAKQSSGEDKDGIHRVRRGETLWSIARLHDVSVGEIMDLNHLDGNALHDGQSIKIPHSATDAPEPGTRPATHLLAKGETFRIVAKKYGITLKDLEKANPQVDPDSPKTGVKLTLPKEKHEIAESKSKAGSPKTHVVTDKDTYYLVAKKYGVTVTALTQANPGVNPDKLHPGTKLNVPVGYKTAVKETAKPEPKAEPEKPEAPVYISTSTSPDTSFYARQSPVIEQAPVAESKPKFRSYVVSEEETAQTISEAFNISTKKLYQMNDLKAGAKFKSGQEIKVPMNIAGIEE